MKGLLTVTVKDGMFSSERGISVMSVMGICSCFMEVDDIHGTEQILVTVWRKRNDTYDIVLPREPFERSRQIQVKQELVSLLCEHCHLETIEWSPEPGHCVCTSCDSTYTIEVT